MEGRKEGRKDGRKAGRKEGLTEGRRCETEKGGIRGSERNEEWFEEGYGKEG
jgi:hypothetical protein